MGSFQFWVEVLLISMLTLFLFTAIGGQMNEIHGLNESWGLGLNDTTSYFTNLEQKANATIAESAVESGGTNTGFSWLGAWGILQNTYGILASIVTGGWISNLVAYAQLPVQVGVVIRVLYLITIAFLLIKVILGRTP